jgi:hypothetical protein
MGVHDAGSREWALAPRHTTTMHKPLPAMLCDPSDEKISPMWSMRCEKQRPSEVHSDAGIFTCRANPDGLARPGSQVQNVCTSMNEDYR